MLNNKLILSHLQHMINEGSGGVKKQGRLARHISKQIPIVSQEIRNLGQFHNSLVAAGAPEWPKESIIKSTAEKMGEILGLTRRLDLAQTRSVTSVPTPEQMAQGGSRRFPRRVGGLRARGGAVRSGQMPPMARQQFPSGEEFWRDPTSYERHKAGLRSSPSTYSTIERQARIDATPFEDFPRGHHKRMLELMTRTNSDVKQPSSTLRVTKPQPRGQISSGMMKGLAGGIAGLGVGALADIGTRKALQMAGVENETAQDVAGTMAGGVAGGAAGSAAAGLGAGAGAAAGAAGAAGALGGWYAARGILKAADKLTGSDLSQQKTNPVEIAADYMKDRRRDQEVDKAEKERLARAASPEGQKRKAQMAAILRGETPEL